MSTNCVGCVSNKHTGNDLLCDVCRLLGACRVCDDAITEFLEAEQPTSTDWINLQAARQIARTAIAMAKEPSITGESRVTKANPRVTQ